MPALDVIAIPDTPWDRIVWTNRQHIMLRLPQLDAGVRVTGCTVHFVDNQYDHGPIIWQQPVPVFDDDTADTLAKRVFEIEKEAYPHVLRLLAAGRIKLENGRATIVKPQRGERSRSAAYPMD